MIFAKMKNMIFDIISIFPELIKPYFQKGLLSSSQKKGLIKVRFFNPRDFTQDKHKTVDDTPYGGGPGMVMKIEPIFKAVQKAKKIKKKKRKVILFSLKGEILNQKLLRQLLKLEHLILICGRYEGVDERVAKYIADKVISLGNFILSGGELPALVLIESLTRLIPSAIGKKESIEEERLKKLFGENFLSQGKEKILSYPVYTRPEKFYPFPKNKKICWSVPKVLLSGNHQKISLWRKKEIEKYLKKDGK